MAKKITEDIKPSWLNPIRAAQAACRSNRGYAILTLKIVVDKNDPVAWLDPELSKIHPARLAGGNLSPSLLGIMLELGKDESAG
jgi:hypothetical protein